MSCESCPTGKVSWVEFIPYISLEVQGVPDEIAAHNIRLAAIEFASRTGAIRQTVCIDAQACVDNYCVEFDDCYRVKALNRVCYGGRDYKAMRQWSHCPPACSYFYEHPCDLYISPAPSCDERDAIEVEVVLIPGQDSCFVDRKIYDEYAEVIAHGARQRLLMIPDTEWYDPRMAGYYSAQFRKGIAQAKQDVMRRNNFGPMKMTTPSVLI